jgi:hypothetical protein
MNDELLRALGRHQREELAALEAAALEHDELLRPFDDRTRDALLDAALVRPGAQVIELRRRRVAVIGVLLASAAALTFVIRGAGEGSQPDPGQAVAVLPDYTGQLRGGQARQRGEQDRQATLELMASDEIDWLLTPAEPVSGKIGVVLVAEGSGARAHFVPDPHAQIAESGAIRLRTELDQLIALEPGEWTLTLLIGPPGDLPSNLADARAEGSWQRVSVRVIIVAGP